MDELLARDGPEPAQVHLRTSSVPSLPLFV